MLIAYLYGLRKAGSAENQPTEPIQMQIVLVEYSYKCECSLIGYRDSAPSSFRYLTTLPQSRMTDGHRSLCDIETYNSRSK